MNPAHICKHVGARACVCLQKEQNDSQERLLAKFPVGTEHAQNVVKADIDGGQGKTHRNLSSNMLTCCL